jgi:hypothetical protein
LANFVSRLPLSLSLSLSLSLTHTHTHTHTRSSDQIPISPKAFQLLIFEPKKLGLGKFRKQKNWTRFLLGLVLHKGTLLLVTETETEPWNQWGDQAEKNLLPNESFNPCVSLSLSLSLSLSHISTFLHETGNTKGLIKQRGEQERGRWRSACAPATMMLMMSSFAKKPVAKFVPIEIAATSSCSSIPEP